MKAASLLLVFVLAKVTVLAGHHIAFSWWSPIAWFWQDAVVVLAFAAIEYCLGPRKRVAWVIYGALALYAIVNIPVGRALSTPLTWPMLRAARGALSDSMWYYVTWQNVLLLASVLSAAALTRLLFQRMPRRPLLAVLVLFAALGPAAAAHVDTLGLERNEWTALIASALPHMPSRASAGEQRSTELHSSQARES